ncbi:hypothetical protein V8G54_006297 [Vigna mungo]|uniref:Uncharacterized protein n=1 Tax=Vigna mungo TaxID=3915 RepID=A0AAQ3NZP7_VIGMU
MDHYLLRFDSNFPNIKFRELKPIFYFCTIQSRNNPKMLSPLTYLVVVDEKTVDHDRLHLYLALLFQEKGLLKTGSIRFNKSMKTKMVMLLRKKRPVPGINYK